MNSLKSPHAPVAAADPVLHLLSWLLSLALQKRMNLTKTIHKTPIDGRLVKLGAAEQEKQQKRPKYDAEYAWVSHPWTLPYWPHACTPLGNGPGDKDSHSIQPQQAAKVCTPQSYAQQALSGKGPQAQCLPLLVFACCCTPCISLHALLVVLLT